MYKLRRKLFSQNFLHSRKLISKLVRSSSIGKHDLVLEIGPGKGIITKQLLQQAHHVLAVEIDNHLYTYLQDKFSGVENLTIYQGDFLTFSLPELPYKVFASIPFAIEGKIIRKLIDAENPPEDCYLIMMKELAYRLAAPYRENMFSLMHKPWFQFSIVYHFRPTDFTPIPSVHTVLFRFTLRKDALLPLSEKPRYQNFIIKGFGDGLPVLQNLKRVCPNSSVKRALQKLSISKDAKPSQVTLNQWLALFEEIMYFYNPK